MPSPYNRGSRSRTGPAVDPSTIPGLGSTPTAEAFGDTQGGGSASTASKNDHRHAMPAITDSVSTTSSTTAASATAVKSARDTAVQITGGGLETVKVIGNSGASKTLALVAGTDGNVQTVANSASCTYTMPSGLTSGVGISFTLIVTNGGAFTATFTGVKWAAGTAPTLTSGDTKVDIFSFLTTDGGTTWYGTVVQDVR